MVKLTADAKQKAAVQAEVLARLTEADRAQGADDDTSSDLSATATNAAEATNGTTRQAVAYALAQVGDSYVWGAEGPSAFDCSGLMVAAYRSAGVSITHSAIGLSRTGRSVSKSNLQPGDLIFWYSPVHHVGIYVGGGMMVHARNVRVGVVKQSVDSYIRQGAPYSGAVRIVG
jgi:cell wall-associated NlpC family hydrolase